MLAESKRGESGTRKNRDYLAVGRETGNQEAIHFGFSQQKPPGGQEEKNQAQTTEGPGGRASAWNGGET